MHTSGTMRISHCVWTSGTLSYVRTNKHSAQILCRAPLQRVPWGPDLKSRHCRRNKPSISWRGLLLLFHCKLPLHVFLMSSCQIIENSICWLIGHFSLKAWKAGGIWHRYEMSILDSGFWQPDTYEQGLNWNSNRPPSKKLTIIFVYCRTLKMMSLSCHG